MYSEKISFVIGIFCLYKVEQEGNFAFLALVVDDVLMLDAYERSGRRDASRRDVEDICEVDNVVVLRVSLKEG